MVNNVSIENSYRSDHSGVVLRIKISQIEKGIGLWKLNNSLLFAKEYVKLVKETIIKITCQYAVPVYNLDNIDQIPKDKTHFTINDQLFLETLLMEISISYSVYKKKKYTELEQNLWRRPIYLTGIKLKVKSMNY